MSKEKVKKETEKIIGKGRRILRYSVNIFIYTIVGIFMLLMVFFGVSQTSFFKDWLRDTIVENVNEGINGKLSIGKIDGTIFTSLIITDASLTDSKSDTIVIAEKIELKTSPLKILFKDIYVRKFELSNTKIKLIEEEDGQLNLLKIFPSSEESEDTTSSEFPFTIEVANFKLTNVNFSLQKPDKVGSTEYYPNMVMDDLRINDLNVSFNAFADLNKYEYRLTIDNISFNPNFKFFTLKHLGGTIILTPQIAGINKLHLITDQSDIELTAGISQVDLVKNFSTEKLKNAPLRLSLHANKLNFEEITTYVQPLSILNGNIFAQLEASGTLNDLNVQTLFVNFDETNLNAKAKLKNILDTDKMFLDVSFKDSYVNPIDIKNLLKGVSVPDLSELGEIKFDTLNYSGNPTKFNSTFALTTDKGNLNGKAFLDFTKKDMIYNVEFATNNLDASLFTSISTNLNSKFTISGIGTNPKNMKFKMDGMLNNSSFGESYLNGMTINSSAENGVIKTNFNINSDSLYALLDANIDFDNPDDPTYQISGKVAQLNLGKLLSNQSLDSQLNITLDASGQGFNPDSMDLFLVTDIKQSHFSDLNVDSSRLILDVRRNDNGLKIINLISDIADFTLSGDYSITSLSEVISREAKIISNVVEQKVNKVLYPDSLISIEQNQLAEAENTPVENFSIDYLLDFKEQLKINVGVNQIEVDGLISGEIGSKDDSLKLALKSDFNYLKFWNQKDLYFVVNTSLDCKISNELNENSDLFDANLTMSAERIYATSNFYNLKSVIKFYDNELSINLKCDYDEVASASVYAVANFNNEILNFNVHQLTLQYDKFNITNKDPLLISYSRQTINFDDFKLYTADGTISLTGDFGSTGQHHAKLLVENLSGTKIAEDLLEISSDKKFSSDIDIVGDFSGNFSNPLFTLSANVNDILFANGNFGSIISKFNYANNSLNTDIKILDSLKNFEVPTLIVTGIIPLNISSQKDSTIKSTGLLDLTIQSNDLDLSSLKKAIPYIQFQKGKLETDIYLSGTISKPVAMGYFSIKDATLKVIKNNLTYDLNAKIWIDDEVITIEEVDLGNTIGTSNGGTMKGNGIVVLKNFSPDSVYFTVNGDLKLLDKVSQNASPMVYGDLAIQTRENILFTSMGSRSYLNLPIDITVADLIMPLGSSAYSSSSGFIYKYYNHTSNKDKLLYELDSLIQLSTRKAEEKLKATEASKFDYTINIKLKTEAEIVINLAKKLDQNLNLVLGGDFFIESIEGKSRSGGALQLLDGSKLTFIKTFETTGNVRFEKLDNPMVDLTATYKDYYYPVGSENGNSNSNEQEVAIKIKLKGPLSELNRNFINDENNIGVYMGRQDIEDDKKDPTKTASDAMFFIVTGKFTDGASQQDRSAVASTAAALAGSLIGGVLNQYFDDYIKSFQLRQTGTEYRFSLIGKAGNFKYEIGGSTDVLQDLSRANIKIEYPMTQKLQLRLERKESETQFNSINAPLYNELGVKYNFLF